MAAEEDDDKKKSAKGFAGLSSLVSDVDIAPAPVAKDVPRAAAGSSPNARSPPQPSKTPPQTAAPQPKSDSYAGAWILGIIILGLFWFLAETIKEPSSQAPTAANSSPSATAPVVQKPSAPEEAKPPVGQGLVLSMAQIRYCLAEDIRIESSKSALNNYIDSDVNRFNATVSDYNSRCGSFRYRSGALESARRDVEPFRNQLQTEGRNRFVSSPSSGALSDPSPSRLAPDATVQAIQLKLNELGYDAGTPDGLIGSGTRSAIIAFQEATGVAATGVASEALIPQLQQAIQRSIGGSGPEDTLALEPESRPSTEVSAPAPRPTLVEPPTTPLAQAPSTEESILAGVDSSERAGIENACGYHKRNSGPADYYGCLRRELASLTKSAGRPDISRASASEQAAIENACGYQKRNSGPGDYYVCLRRELSQLTNSAGRPDMARASASEQAAIENACGFHKRNSGPGEYYGCLRRELANLVNSAGQPDLSRARQSERSAIENACGFHKRNSGPGDYYNCLRREIASLSRSGGAPDLSRASASEQAAIENACGYHRRNSGPGDYYSCLRGEFNKLAYR